MSQLQSANLKLPFIAPSQAQKHVTHNEALNALDAILQLSVLDRDLATPPVSPGGGERYLIAAAATGAWAGKDGLITAFQDGAWVFFEPQNGWVMWIDDEKSLQVFSDGLWAETNPNSLPQFGINTDADPVNRLAVKADSVLHSHDDVTPGTGSARHVINKNTPADTAAVIFQTGWSGRAEFGLTGNDDWHVKTSPDGTSWADTLIADSATGAVRFPAGIEEPVTRARIANMLLVTPADGVTSIVRFDRARTRDPRTTTIANVSGDIITLASADADLVFHPFMRGVSYVRVWNTSKATPEPAWVKYDPAYGGTNDQLQVTNAIDISGWLAGETLQLGDQNGWPDVPVGFSRGYALDISPMLQALFGTVFPQKGLTFKNTVFGVTGRAGLSATPTGLGGSYIGGNSLSDGSPNVGMSMVGTSVLSPISNSNLVFIREDQDAGGQIGIATLVVAGIWV